MFLQRRKPFARQPFAGLLSANGLCFYNYERPKPFDIGSLQMVLVSIVMRDVCHMLAAKWFIFLYCYQRDKSFVCYVWFYFNEKKDNFKRSF